jgi:sorting nexin-9/18/33
LNNAITITGEAYEDIAKMYEDQPKNDWEPLGDVMYDYKGILAGWPGILQIHSVSQDKVQNVSNKIKKVQFLIF